MESPRISRGRRAKPMVGGRGDTNEDRERENKSGAESLLQEHQDKSLNCSASECLTQNNSQLEACMSASQTQTQTQTQIEASQGEASASNCVSLDPPGDSTPNRRKRNNSQEVDAQDSEHLNTIRAACAKFRVGSQVHCRSHGRRSPEQRTDSVSPWSSRHFSFSKSVAGNGHYGVVVKSVHNPDRVTVAIKRLSKKTIVEDVKKGGRRLKILQREVEIHSHIRHENIVRFYGYFDDPEYVNLVLHYTPNGDLHEYIASQPGQKVSLNTARRFLRQVASALSYLDSASISHRDVKEENILLSSTGKIQLCDFGWAVHYKKGQLRSTLCGTPDYIPPEMLSSDPYDPRYVDAWALGVLAYSLLFHENPFGLDEDSFSDEEVTREQQRQILTSIQQFTKLTFPKDSDPAAVNFVDMLVQKNPRRRMSTTDALHHHFLAERSSPIKSRSVVYETPQRKSPPNARLAPVKKPKRERDPEEAWSPAEKRQVRRRRGT